MPPQHHPPHPARLRPRARHDAPRTKTLRRLGYINIARAPLVARSTRGTDVALTSGTVIHTLWQVPTVKKLMQEGRAVHYKLLLDVRRQLRSAEELG